MDSDSGLWNALYSTTPPNPIQPGPLGCAGTFVHHCLASFVFRSPIGTKGTWITLTRHFDGDSLPILRRNKPVIELLRHCFHSFWRRFGQLLRKPPCRSHARQPLEALHQIKNKPGEPRNTAKAGTTVFGGRMVSSSILAQSLIMQNFPCKSQCKRGSR